MARDDKGQDLVEFALVIPILLVLVLGVFELGRFVHAYIIVTTAAGDGARYGSMTAGEDPNDPEVIEAIRDVVLDRTNHDAEWVTIQREDITVTFPDGSTAPGNAIRVDVAFDYLPQTSAFLSLPPLTASAFNEMVIYQ